jgi:hypothetical protein
MAHPDAVKAAALAAYDTIGTRDGYAIARAAAITVAEWVRNERFVNGDVTRIRQEKKSDLADECEDMARGIIGSMPAKLEDASLQQSATAAGILIDKAQLLRQRPTSIQAGVYLTQEQRVARLDAIFAPHRLQLAEKTLVQAQIVEEERDESRVKLPPAGVSPGTLAGG